jgi:6-phosphogluconolactonase
MNSKKLLLIITALLVSAPMAAFGGYRHFNGAVYAMTNDTAGNAIVAFARDFRGRLTKIDTFATGGLGGGGGIDPLASQGSLVLSRNNRWLFAVNAGSNDISVFRVRHHDLELVGYYESGGTFPVSVTSYHNLLYVLNAGGKDAKGNDIGANITGFRIDRRGRLTPLDESTRPLDGAGFHQVGFGPRGDALVVTQGSPTGPNTILVFGIGEDGLPDSAPVASPSVGVVPFGFVFDWLGHLLVAEAGSMAVSSYGLNEDNTLTPISRSIVNGNAATCWIANTWYGAVFTANTGNNNISAYKVRIATGSLRLRDAEAATGNKPIDMATAANGKYLYALNAADGTVTAFRIHPNGKLRLIDQEKGLPVEHAQGIAAY